MTSEYQTCYLSARAPAVYATGRSGTVSQLCCCHKQQHCGHKPYHCGKKRAITAAQVVTLPHLQPGFHHTEAAENKAFILIVCLCREGGEDGDSQGDGSSQPDTISIASRTSQNTVDSDKVESRLC